MLSWSNLLANNIYSYDVMGITLKTTVGEAISKFPSLEKYINYIEIDDVKYKEYPTSTVIKTSRDNEKKSIFLKFTGDGVLIDFSSSKKFSGLKPDWENIKKSLQDKYGLPVSTGFNKYSSTLCWGDCKKSDRKYANCEKNGKCLHAIYLHYDDEYTVQIRLTNDEASNYFDSKMSKIRAQLKLKASRQFDF